MVATVRSNKAKGRRLQQWVCQQLARIGDCSWGSDDDMEIQSRPMSQSGVDVILRGRAAELFPYSFECKSGESMQLVKSIKQARDNKKKDTDWILVHRRQAFSQPIVMMDWNTFERLIQPKS